VTVTTALWADAKMDNASDANKIANVFMISFCLVAAFGALWLDPPIDGLRCRRDRSR
jgi:hypothetical protein